MDQEAVKSGLQALERKISFLLQTYSTLKQDLKKSAHENTELRTLLKERDEQLKNFKNQVNINKIAGQLNPEDNDVSVLRKKVDEYIREIDKCILHASR